MGLGGGRLLQGAAAHPERGGQTAAATFTLLVLGWALMLSCEAGNWPGAAALRLEPAGIPLLPLVQGAILLAGLALTAICVGGVKAMGRS